MLIMDKNLKELFDTENWERNNHYNFFKNFDNPFYNITFNLDITNLYKYCKNYNISIFLAYLYITIKAANEIMEFKLRIENGKLYKYNRIHPFTTILNNNNTFNFCDLNYYDNFPKFSKEAKKRIERIKNNNELVVKDYRKDVIHFSTIPWIKFTSISHSRNFNTEDSVPKIVFGKIDEFNDKFYIPISTELHHSLADGYHIGLFHDLLNDYILNCNEILS